MPKRLFNRKFRSWVFANIILENGLFNEWKIYSYSHPKIKSKYRLANLFLMNRGLLYKHVDNIITGVNMDNIEDFYYD